MFNSFYEFNITPRGSWFTAVELGGSLCIPLDVCLSRCADGALVVPGARLIYPVELTEET